MSSCSVYTHNACHPSESHRSCIPYRRSPSALSFTSLARSTVSKKDSWCCRMLQCCTSCEQRCYTSCMLPGKEWMQRNLSVWWFVCCMIHSSSTSKHQAHLWSAWQLTLAVAPPSRNPRVTKSQNLRNSPCLLLLELLCRYNRRSQLYSSLHHSKPPFSRSAIASQYMSDAHNYHKPSISQVITFSSLIRADTGSSLLSLCPRSASVSSCLWTLLRLNSYLFMPSSATQMTPCTIIIV